MCKLNFFLPAYSLAPHLAALAQPAAAPLATSATPVPDAATGTPAVQRQPPTAGPSAPPVASDLRGIFVVSYGFSLSSSQEVALKAALAVPGVDGFYMVLGWDAITDEFKQSFPDKFFSVAIIASAAPFPPIVEDGSLIKGAVTGQSLPLVTPAS